eukprot:TRINITY_DN66324_c4_g1_i2.p1 TRINITY_DN66324_c4_g1~~TRINITY_DN66324_c4_g1_i2.p1  ORF type:complete len:697 (-),score=311.18 TRINITY_DN66324_c4_g1_i2:39-2129(-)
MGTLTPPKSASVASSSRSSTAGLVKPGRLSQRPPPRPSSSDSSGALLRTPTRRPRDTPVPSRSPRTLDPLTRFGLHPHVAKPVGAIAFRPRQGVVVEEEADDDDVDSMAGALPTRGVRKLRDLESTLHQRRHGRSRGRRRRPPRKRRCERERERPVVASGDAVDAEYERFYGKQTAVVPLSSSSSSSSSRRWVWLVLLLLPLVVLRSGVLGWKAVPKVRLAAVLGDATSLDVVGGETASGSASASASSESVEFEDLPTWRVATSAEKKKTKAIQGDGADGGGDGGGNSDQGGQRPFKRARNWQDDLNFEKSTMNCHKVQSKDGYHTTQCQFENVIVKDGSIVTLYNQDLPSNQETVGSFGHWNGWKNVDIVVQKVSAPLRVDDCASIVNVPTFFFAQQFFNVDYWHSLQMTLNLYQTIAEYSEKQKSSQSPTSAGFGGLLDKNNHLCAQFVDKTHRYFNTIRDYFGLLGMLTQNPLQVQTHSNVCYRRAIIGFSPSLDFNVDPKEAGITQQRRQEFLDRFVRFFTQHVGASLPPATFLKPRVTVAYRKLPEQGSSDSKKRSFDKEALQNMKMWAGEWNIDLSMVVFEDMEHKHVIEHMGRTTVFIAIHGAGWANAAFLPQHTVGVLVQPTRTFSYFPTFFQRLVKSRSGDLLTWKVDCCGEDKTFVSVEKEEFKQYLRKALSMGVHQGMDHTWKLD